jgi:hypothetical protein
VDRYCEKGDQRLSTEHEKQTTEAKGERVGKLKWYIDPLRAPLTVYVVGKVYMLVCWGAHKNDTAPPRR